MTHIGEKGAFVLACFSEQLLLHLQLEVLFFQHICLQCLLDFFFILKSKFFVRGDQFKLCDMRGFLRCNSCILNESAFYPAHFFLQFTLIICH